MAFGRPVIMSERITTASRIFVTGHRGMVGSALLKSLRRQDYGNLIFRDRRELDLLDQAAVNDFILAERPDYVFVAAAKVGGILANNTYPADFIHQNLVIAVNVIHSAFRAGVKRLMYLGSSCIYPRDCPQPMKEEYFLTGPLEPTNESYAIAKIAGIKMCESYNRQHGTRYVAAMPTNLYGPGDNYDLENSHVLPALIRKVHEAKTGGSKRVMVWGTGTPRREFLFSDDLADACVFLMEHNDEMLAECNGRAPFINVGCGEDISIRDLAELVGEVVGYDGEFDFDPSKPDGMPVKRLDVTQLVGMGWRARTPLRDGIAAAYAEFLQRQHVPERPAVNSQGHAQSPASLGSS
jgi:GDP-L-fucose synthase